MRSWPKTAASLSLLFLASVTTISGTQEPTGAIGTPKTVQETRPSEPVELVPGKPIEREMKGGETHSYRVTVGAGQYMHVVADQRGIDVVLVLYGLDGQKLFEMDSPNGTQGPEAASLVAKASGTYRVDVRTFDSNAPLGRYEVRIEPMRSATPQDESRVAAERGFAEGALLKAQGTADGQRAAIVKYEEALRLWRALEDRLREGYTLGYIVGIYMRLGEPQKALAYCNQALLIFRALRDRAGEAGALNNVGGVYGALGEIEKALDFYSQSLAIRRALGDRAGEAATLSNIGLVYSNLGEPQRALDYYNQALPIGRAVGDRFGDATTLNNIGRVYSNLGEKQKALDYYNQALPIFRAVGNRAGEATTLSRIGGIYYALEERQKALGYYNLAFPIFRAVRNRNGEATALDHMGQVYSALGEKQKALDYFNQALQINRAVADRSGEATSLIDVGRVHDDLGEPQRALDYHNQALPIRRAVGNRLGEAATLDNIGTVYADLGEKQQALDYFNEALQIYRAVEDRSGEATSLIDVGAVYYDLGENEKALDYFKRAVAIKESVGDRSGEATSLNNIGAVYRGLGEEQKALDYYNQALPINRAVGDRSEEAHTLNNIGLVYSDLGEKQKALDYYNQALPISRAVGDRSGEARMLNNIGLVYSAPGEKQKALDYFNQALPIHRAVGDRSGEALTLANIAVVQRDLGNLVEARALIEEALRIINSLRTKIDSPELRASYFSTVQWYYKFYIALLMQLHRQHPSEGYDRHALEASERGRARSLLEILLEAQTDIRHGVDSRLLERERSLQQLLDADVDRRMRLLTGKRSEEQMTEASKEIQAITMEYQQVEAQIRVTSPRYAALTQPQPLGLKEIQQLLDPYTVMLEYSLGEPRSYLWAVAADSVQSYELPSRVEVEKAARQVYELLTARSRGVTGETETETGRMKRWEQAEIEYPEAARQLSDMVLGPVQGQIRGKRLVIVGDGALQYIPFGALPEPGEVRPTNSAAREDKPPVPLLVNHEIVSLPSASVLSELRKEGAARKVAPKLVAILADPVFDAQDTRVARVTGKKELASNEERGGEDSGAQILTNSLAASRLTRSATEAGFSGALFPRLVFSRREADSIMTATPAGQGREELDFQASRAAASKPELSQYRIVHFATHGLLDSEHPELSGLVLSMVDEQGRAQNGFLDLQDIYNLNLPADLVVLSACETGLGKAVRGEGLVGLTRGFMYAGATRVVASLWKVDDVATSKLMGKFYEEMLTEGRRPAEALREAQIEMWKQKRWSFPYYWATFVLQGEWR